MVARSVDKLKRVGKKCNELGAGSANYISADLASDKQSYHQKVIDDAVERLGGLDTLVLNHISSDGNIDLEGYYNNLDMESVRWVFNVNTFSYFALADAATKALEGSYVCSYCAD